MNALKSISVKDIINIATVNAYTGRQIKITNRAYFGLSFCKSGKITYSHLGKDYISSPECAVILPAAASYELYNNRGGEFPLINFSCSGEAFTENFITIPLNHTKAYISDYEKMKRLSMQNGSRLKIMSIFYDLLERLSKEYESKRPELNRAIHFINDSLSRSELTNSEIADAAGVCESYLRRLFNEYYSTTPKQYIIEARIKKATQLLSENRKTVTEISDECGFSSVYHFCRAFKAYSGITPTQYRKYNSVGW